MSKSAHIARASPDVDSGLIVQAALASLWRRKRLVLGIVTAALMLGIIAAVVMPKRYTAEAYIRGEFLASDTAPKDEKSTSLRSISLDLGRVIETQSRLLQSHQVALRVVQQIGLERLQPLSEAMLPTLQRQQRENPGRSRGHRCREATERPIGEKRPSSLSAYGSVQGRGSRACSPYSKYLCG